MIVAERDGAAVRLSDVATVRMGTKEREEITRVNGRECVEIAIFKEGDANTVTAARAIRQRLDEWKKKLPEGYEMSVMFDQSHFIEQSINEVRKSAVIGGILAVIVLFLFLREMRSTLIIALSIPLSVVATFMFMYRFNISLNVMSLGGLTLGVGMLVDNSIVVLESIFRKKKAGLSLARAALEGADEVGAAVVASTLTTVAVFLPIVFVEGIAGQLFRDQALTVTFSLLASLAVAVTLIPMLSALGEPVRKADLEGPPVSTAAAEDAEDAHGKLTLGAFSRVYDRFVRAAVARPWVTLAIAFATVRRGHSGGANDRHRADPAAHRGRVLLRGQAARGQFAVGHRPGNSGSRDCGGRRPAHRPYVRARGQPSGVRWHVAQHEGREPRTAQRGAEGQVERPGGGVGGRRVCARGSTACPTSVAKFGRPAYFSLKTPIEVVLYGEDLELLRGYSLDLTRSLETVPGLVDVRSSLEAGNPELQVVFNRDRAGRARAGHRHAVADAAEPRAGRGADALQGRRPPDRHPHPQPRVRPHVGRRRAQPGHSPGPTESRCG